MSNNTNELSHHGIPGMKWGVRRYQNKDGSLTPAGKRREAKLDKQMSSYARKYNKLKSQKLTGKNDTKESRPKTIKEMSDTEIQAKINRIRKEQELASLQPQQVSKGKKFISSLANDVIAPAAKEAGKRVLTNWLDKTASDALGLNSKDELATLKKEVETLELRKRKKDAVDYLKGRQDESKRLAKEATDYENRKKIDDGQKRFKEGKYAQKKEEEK